MVEIVLTDIYRDIKKTGVDPRHVFKLLIFLDEAVNIVSVIKYWFDNIQNTSGKLFAYEDGQPINVKRKYWRMSDEEKV